MKLILFFTHYLFVVILFILSSCNLSAQYNDVPLTPLPKIEVGTHTDRTTGLAVDALNHRVITAGDDRTIRVWDLASGQLEKIFRVPMAARKEGEIYSLAYESNTQTIAVGGWSGLTWDGTTSVYLFDLQSGKMKRPLQGFHDRITALAFSDDGQRLAVALNDGQLFLFKIPKENNSDYEFIAHNKDCKDISYRMDFSTDGRLVTNCFDGIVRVFDDKLKLIVQTKPDGGAKPSGVDFSPNGRHIAVGFHDTNVVSVLNSETLEEQFRPDTSVISKDQQVPQVVWSASGAVLYAAGELNENSNYQIISWDNYGKGEPKIYEASSKRVFRMLAMPTSGVAYTTLDQAVGILDEMGERTFFRKPPIIDHQFNQADFRVSPDGDTVMFLAKNNQKYSYVKFSLHNRMLTVSDTTDRNLIAPLIKHKNFPVSDWSDSKVPMFGNKSIEIFPYQRSNAMAIDPNGKFFALGIDAEIRRFNQQGDVEWAIYPQSNAFALNVTSDGEKIVGAFQDGSVRWYRSIDGHEIMALFVHENLEDWVVWVPDGFFLSSPQGDQYIGWQLNNGKDVEPDYYTAFQFERLLYRPDLVDKYFMNQGSWGQLQSEVDRAFTVNNIRESAPPDIEISQVSPSSIVESSNNIELELNIKKRILPIKEYSVFVNGLPVVSYEMRQLIESERKGFNRIHNIPLSEGLNEVRVEVLTEKSLGLQTTYIEQSIETKTLIEDQKKNLYIFGIGVNQLINSPNRSLKYAVADAEAFVNKIKTERAKEFDNIYVKLLSDNSKMLPSKKNIEDQLTFFRSSGPNDTVILYLAAHGMSNKAGDYFLLPADTTDEDIKLLLKNTNKSFNPKSMVKWESFFNALRDASGKRLLIVDSCQARKIEGNFDAGSLIKRSSAASFALMAASKGNEESFESPDFGHGIFTYAILDGLNSNNIDNNSNKDIELSELFAYVSDYVEEFAKGINVSQTPQLYSPEVLLDMSMNSLK